MHEPILPSMVGVCDPGVLQEGAQPEVPSLVISSPDDKSQFCLDHVTLRCLVEASVYRGHHIALTAGGAGTKGTLSAAKRCHHQPQR